MRVRIRQLVVRPLLACACAAAALAGQANAASDGAFTARRQDASADGTKDLAHLRRVVEGRGLAGTVLVYDLRRREYAAVHPERADRRLIPASTFKVFNSLAALDAGVIDDAQSIVRWDGVVRERTELNRDLDLQQAFTLSSVPVYQELARRIGAGRMRRYLGAVGYGNADISGGIDRFWLDGGLRISPREQIAFLVRLYRGDLPFAGRAMQIVRELMVVPGDGPHVVRAKTGWARPGGGRQIGWWVGWVEHGEDVTFFATAIESDGPREDFGPARLAITRDVLAALHVLPPPQP